jgi:hypothetical protein
MLTNQPDRLDLGVLVEPLAWHRAILPNKGSAHETRFGSGTSGTVLLTRVGGGVFGNEDDWIDGAITRALTFVEHAGLDVRLVSYGAVHPSFRGIAERWNS